MVVVSLLAQQAQTPYRDVGARTRAHAHIKRATGALLPVHPVHVYLGNLLKKRRMCGLTLHTPAASVTHNGTCGDLAAITPHYPKACISEV